MNRKNPASMPPELWEEIKRKPPPTRRRVERLWNLLESRDDAAIDAPDTDAAWAELQRRLDAPPAKNKPPRRAPDRRHAPRTKRRTVLQIAAAGLVMGLLLGLWGWRQPVTEGAPPGAHRAVTLPDGSTVELNSDSQLRYARSFQAWPFVRAGKRAVTLQGEAFFDVARDQRPFVVETFNARVEVLGTAFNVRARQDLQAGETRVTLASGTVRVAARAHPEAPVLLSQPGQTARVTDTAQATADRYEAATLDGVLAWRKQGFTAVDQPLAAILAEVERRYALTIAVEEGLALDASMTLFYLRGTTAEQILSDVCLAQGCRYRSTSGGFTLFKAPPPTQ